MIRAVLRFTQLCSVVSVLLFTACGDEDCGEKVASLPCDIRNEACRCTIFDETRKVRDQEGARLPPTRVITRAQYAAELRAMIMGEMAEEGPRVYQESLKVLGLLPAQMSLDDATTDAQIRGVAAYYDSSEKKITIIDDAAEDPIDGMFTLSHEYVHALQDQREGIRELWKQEMTSDGFLSVKTLIEGEATLLSALVVLKSRARMFDMQTLSGLDAQYDATLEAIAESSAPLTEAELALAYPVGALTLGKAYLARGIAGVESFFSNRPRTVTGWLDESRSPSLPEAVSCARPAAPAGYEPWQVDRLGATAAIALGASLGFDTEGMRDLARMWSVDEFALYSVKGTPTSVALSWYFSFASPELAAQLETRLRTARPTLEITRSGSTLHIVGASDPAVLAAWSARNGCSAPKSRDAKEEPRRIGPGFGHILPWVLRLHTDARGQRAPAHVH